MTPVAIRPATTADWPAIWAILAPVFRAGDTYTIDPDISEADAERYWMATGRPYVAERDGAILGTFYIRTNQQGGGAHVCNCGYATSPSARGQGIARQMCIESLPLARALGYKAMQFNFVVTTNKAALHLWESLGFDTVGRLPKAFHHPSEGLVDAVVMYRHLD